MFKGKPQIEKSRHGDFEVATVPSKSGFYAWGKMGAIQGNGPTSEPGGPVWYQFGASRKEARDKLLSELGLKIPR